MYLEQLQERQKTENQSVHCGDKTSSINSYSSASSSSSYYHHQSPAAAYSSCSVSCLKARSQLLPACRKTTDDLSNVYHAAAQVITSAKEVMFLPDFVCLFVCLSVSPRDNSKNYGRIFLKF